MIETAGGLLLGFILGNIWAKVDLEEKDDE